MRSRSQAGGAPPEEKRPRPERVDRAPRPSDTVKISVDLVNEVVLLSALVVLMGRDPAVAGQLARVPADSFYGKGHALMWTALQESCRRGLGYDPATIRQLSGGQADVDQLEGYVRDRPEPPPNLRHHVECLRWDRARVEVVQGPLTAFLDALKDPTSDQAKVRALAASLPAALKGFGDKRYLRDPQALVAEHAKELTTRRTGRAVYPYGIPALDLHSPGDVRRSSRGEESIAGDPRMVPGARPGDITVLTANSGGGKTTTAARIALEQANMQRRVLFGAWEQGSGMTLELLAALSLGWSRTELMIGRFTEEEQRLLLEEMERIGEFVRFFELPFGRDRGEKVKKGKNDLNLDLIQEHIADVAADVFIADLFRQAIAEHEYGLEDDALYRMKGVTTEQRCHTILIHQLKLKDAEVQVDTRPTRALIKGTGAWIEVGDTVIGTHIPGQMKDIPMDKIEFIVLKQRHGAWPQAIECDYDAEYGHIGDGRTIPYQRASEESGEGDLLSTSLTRRSSFGRGKKGR
jgi:KaiC/GvpD/RAD55 family RecA-like ATPase